MKRTAIVTIVILAIGGAVLWASRHGPLLHVPTLTNRNVSELAFAVIGDTESNTDLYSRALSETKQSGAKFMIHVGDLTESGTEEEFKAIQDVEDSSGLPVYAAVGNHDIRDDPTAERFSRFANATNYAVEVEGIRFVFLNNAERKIGFSEETLAWLTREFSEHKGSRYILIYHRPFGLPFSDVTGDDETSASRKFNERFLELLSGKKIIAVFSGHLHTYVPYRVSGAPTYVTGGGGGALGTLETLLSSEPHFLMVRVVGSEVRVEVEQLD
ncbi:MAG: metallophosphoesterase [Candidatus Kerfeldbacteria bacterium]